MTPAFAELRRKSLAVPCVNSDCRAPAGKVCRNTQLPGDVDLAIVPAHLVRLWDCGAVPRPGQRAA